MSKLFSLFISLSMAAGPGASDPVPSSTGWTADGARSCTFDGATSPVRCTQFRMTVRHRLKGGEAWSEYRYKWVGPCGSEVRYASRIGLLGVSNFTIGTVVDRRSKLPDHTSENAVSYAPDRETIIIGVPGDGYEFNVSGGGV